MSDKVHTIVIDPGHGGKDSGAVNGNSGRAEKDVVLKVSLQVRDLLARHDNVKVVMTREDDRYLTLAERAAIANEHGAPLQSIHANSGGGVGFEMFTSPGQTESDRWATICLEEYQKTFPELRMRSDFSDYDPDKEAKFAVLIRTVREAVLIELEFIDSQYGDAFLHHAPNQERMAWAIYLANCRWLGVEPMVSLRLMVREHEEITQRIQILAQELEISHGEHIAYLMEQREIQKKALAEIKALAAKLSEGGSEA